MKEKYKAWIVEQHPKIDQERARIIERVREDPAKNEITVKVEYSSMNYKDAAAIVGSSNILRVPRCVPGIDLCGTVAESNSSEFKEGDKVIATGFGLGEKRDGGMAEYANLPADYCISLPSNMSPAQAMTFGTSGFTACLSIMALNKHGVRKGADILVTSVGGGVGSASAGMAKVLGYRLHAITRKARMSNAKKFDPVTVITREEFLRNIKPLDTQQWDGAIDTAGGQLLSTVLTQMKDESMVTCCGVTAGAEFTTTVMPFILRGVTLKGINSVNVSLEERREIWRMISDELLSMLDFYDVHERSFDMIDDVARDVINFKSTGKQIIKIAK